MSHPSLLQSRFNGLQRLRNRKQDWTIETSTSVQSFAQWPRRLFSKMFQVAGKSRDRAFDAVLMRHSFGETSSRVPRLADGGEKEKKRKEWLDYDAACIMHEHRLAPEVHEEARMTRWMEPGAV